MILSSPLTPKLGAFHFTRSVMAWLLPGSVEDVTAATRLALRRRARRWLMVDEENKQLDAELTRLVEATAPFAVRQRLRRR